LVPEHFTALTDGVANYQDGFVGVGEQLADHDASVAVRDSRRLRTGPEKIHKVRGLRVLGAGIDQDISTMARWSVHTGLDWRW
jgi:hypothetical protein